jgi:hypothetical protein
MSPSPKGFQSPKFSDSDFREVRGLGRPKSSAENHGFLKTTGFHPTYRGQLGILGPAR